MKDDKQRRWSLDLVRNLDAPEQTARSANAIGFAVMNELLATRPTETIVISPWSIASALGLLAAAASGETLHELAAALDIPASFAYDAIALMVKRVAQDAASSGAEMSSAEAAFVGRTLRIEPSFAARVPVHQLDFSVPGPAATTINDWVSGNTNGMIKKIVGNLDPSTMTLLANAVHFKATWDTIFDAKLTQPGLFTTATGAPRTVPMMKRRAPFRTLDGYMAEGIVLPYQSGAFEAVITVDARPNDPFQATVMAQSIVLPKIDIDWQGSIRESLSNAGFERLFEKDAELGRMAVGAKLPIGPIAHAAALRVDEQGAEAAAATAVSVIRSHLGSERHIAFDRPFTFCVRHVYSGLIMFIASIGDPGNAS